MNLPNKLTMSRIILTIIIIVLMLFPFYEINIEFPMWAWKFGEIIEVDSRYIISGVLFVIASLTDMLDGKIDATVGKPAVAFCLAIFTCSACIFEWFVVKYRVREI